MTLRQRIERLERTLRLPDQARPMIIFSCACGWTDRAIPPDFNGLRFQLNTSGGCPHKMDTPKQDGSGTQTPDEVLEEKA